MTYKAALLKIYDIFKCLLGAKYCWAKKKYKELTL